MRLRKKISSCLYILVFTFVSVQNLRVHLSPQAMPYLYYHILMAFEKKYALVYYLALGNAIVNLITLIPLILYISQKRFLNAGVWKTFLALRLLLEIGGRTYEINTIRAIFHLNPNLSILSIILIGAILVPSYEVCFKFAFRYKTLFRKSSS